MKLMCLHRIVNVRAKKQTLLQICATVDSNATDGVDAVTCKMVTVPAQEEHPLILYTSCSPGRYNIKTIQNL